MQEEPKKLFRSQKDCIIAGVCGGLGEYFDIDPVIVRLIFVVLFFAGGSTFLAYIILWIVMPQSPRTEPLTSETTQENVAHIQEKSREAAEELAHNSSDTRMVGGLIILVLGFVFLLQNFRIFQWDFWLRLWPALLIIMGVLILAKRR